MKYQHLVSVAACALAATFTSQAAAQETTPEASQADVSAGTAEGLGDIVVTAQRREENLQRAAIAVDTVDAEMLRESSITNPAQLTALVPALQISPLGASFNYYLRGVGNVNGNPLSESAIAFNFGGVYIGRPASSTAFFYDLERLEILKGPQGTLYGRNATGGAINVIPAAPSHELGGELFVEAGNYESLNTQAWLNVPFSNQAALRIAGFVAQHDGYNEDGTDDQEDMGGRIQLRVEPTADLTINIMGDYASIGGNGLGSTPVGLGLDGRYGATSPAANAFYEGQPHAIGGRNFFPIPPLSYQDNEFWGFTTTIDWRTDAGTFTVIPAYRESSIASQSASAGFMVTELSETAETSFEARFASDESNRLRALLGAYYYDANTDVPLFMVNNQFDYVNTFFTHDTTSEAVFGRLTYDVTPALRANVGLRYTHETKELVGNNLTLTRICLGGFLACPTATPFPYGTTELPTFTEIGGVIIPEPNPDNPTDGTLQVGTRILRDEEASFNRLTWRAGVDWDIGPQNLLYLSFETGFKSGGFFFTHDEGVYDPETIEAWTLGSKNRFFDNRLQLNLEAFWWSYQDQQISHVAIDSAGTAVFITENVAAATMRGMEFDVQYLLTPQTLLSADLQYLDAVYDDFTYLFPNLGAPPATTCPTTFGGANYAIDCSGQRPPLAPEWTINLGIEQTFDLSNSGEIVVVGRMHYQSETLTSLEYLPDQFQDAYATYDASLTYRAPGHRFSIGAFVNNLTDETVMAGSFIPVFAATNFVDGILRPPRTYGIRTSVSF